MRIRKWMAYLLIAGTITANVQTSYATVLHTISESQTVTNGVTLIKDEVLTSNGWQDIHALRIDLSNPYISLGMIESSNIGERKTVTDLVNESNAIAGVNGDFFDMSGSYSPAFGPSITDGTLNHAYNSNYTELGPKKSMATFLIDEYNNPLMGYYGVEMSLVIEGNTLFDITNFNKLSGALSRPIAIDSTYYSDNQSVLEHYAHAGSAYTVIIEDGQVVYKSLQDEVVPIEDGQVAIIMNVATAVTYYPQIQVGQSAEFKTSLVLNGQVVEAIESLQMGIGGGGLIMQNGAAYTGAAHQVTPATRAPRTVVATTYVPNEVLLLTIDGRVNTLGATHAELVEILKRYNVKDAMYLDGGGSTTLVAREEASSEVTLQNTPSDGSQRRVTNGIGIFTNAPAGELGKLYLETPQTHTFVGEKMSFSLNATDEYGNPLAIQEENINLYTIGIEGIWDGTDFYPQSQGQGIVVAESGDVQTTMDIVVTDAPAGIRIETPQIIVSEQGTTSVNVVGVDKYGYEVAIDQEIISWESNVEGVTVQNGTVSATDAGIGTIKATYKGISDSAELVVGERVVPIYSFEDSNGRWLASDSSIEGKVEPSKEIKYHGNQALKMTYTFGATQDTQVAYTVFDNPITIPEDTRSINMWVYAQGQEDAMKLQLVDANGDVHYLDFASDLAYSGWKYQTVQLDENIALPAQLTRAYVYTPSNSEKRTNAIYMDHMSITRGLRGNEYTSARSDYQFDPSYRENMAAPNEGDYIINITGSIKNDSLQDSEINALYSQLGQHDSKVLFASANNAAHTLQNTATYANNYQALDEKGVAIRFVGTNSGGLRQTDASQWLTLQKDLEMLNQDVVIVMGSNPLTQFSDQREGEALHECLVAYKERTGKDVFVIYQSTTKETMIEKGVRYIGVPSLDDEQNYEYLQLKIYQGNIYYTFQPML